MGLETLNYNEQRVLDTMQASKDPLTLNEIAEQGFTHVKSLVQAKSWVRNSMRALVRGGMVKQVDRGTYALKDAAVPAGWKARKAEKRASLKAAKTVKVKVAAKPRAAKKVAKKTKAEVKKPKAAVKPSVAAKAKPKAAAKPRAAAKSSTKPSKPSKSVEAAVTAPAVPELNGSGSLSF